ncbi:TCP-1/cpn60 chaperonin family protein [Tanacetum coccineum]
MRTYAKEEKLEEINNGEEKSSLLLLWIMVLKIASQFELDCFCRTTDAVPLLGNTVDPSFLGYVDSISVEETRGARVTVTNEQGGVATVLLGVGARTTVAGATEIEIARLREFSFKETWILTSVRIDGLDAQFCNSAITCQQDAKRNNEMAPILQSIMQDDEEFKRGWLGTKGVGDKIFGLSPHALFNTTLCPSNLVPGRNIPRRKEEQEVFCVTTSRWNMFSIRRIKYVVKWYAGNDGIVVEHQLGIDLLCIENCGSDDASVHNLVKSICDLCNANANVMKVHGVKISNDVYHF